MKIMLLTTPIRSEPTEFPPVACLCLQKALRKAGYHDVYFYDIDNLRPSPSQVVEALTRYAPDIVGISAVVSTAYAYTKWLSAEIRKALPHAQIVLGGNLGASGDVVLHRTSVDFCVLGEGERVFTNFVRAVEAGARAKRDFAGIKGLLYLDNGQLVNTGYEEQIPKEEVYDYDWEDLEKSSRIEHFFQRPERSPAWGYWSHVTDKETSNTRSRRGQTVATIMTHKGCVARCTFCHRWDRGVRYIPVDIVIERIKYVVDKYNVGFISMGGENFGSDRKWTMELCEKLKPLGLIWRVAGIRANTVTQDLIHTMKDAGCVCLIYGMETGSARMLKIMEKNLDLEKNRNAMQWTVDAGLYTGVQLVLGMPGETTETIAETAEFTKWALTLHKGQNPNSASINYAQALPGTPLYEFARMRGLIGSGIDAEERYLLQVNDTNASNTLNTLNFTDYPKLVCDTWQALIQIETCHAYIQKFGWQQYRDVVASFGSVYAKKDDDNAYFTEPQRTLERISRDSLAVTFRGESGYGAMSADAFPPLWKLVLKNQWKPITVFYPVFCYRLRRFLIPICLLRAYKQQGRAAAWTKLKEYVAFQWKALRGGIKPSVEYVSLRKVTDPLLAMQSEPAMVQLRRGR